MSNSVFGFFYYAIGRKYVVEACNSAQSIKKHMKNTEIVIFTNREGKKYLIPGLFNKVIVTENETFSFLDNIECLRQTPFENTIFIDSDTEMISPVYELNPLFDKFDLCICHAPNRFSFQLTDCPQSFPECNTGFILYKKNEKVLDLFKDWHNICKLMFSNNDKIHDQPGFRQALYESDLRYYILPPEYNTRTVYPFFKGGNMKVKILHGSPKTMAKAKKYINSYNGVKVGNYNKFRFKSLRKKLRKYLLKYI